MPTKPDIDSTALAPHGMTLSHVLFFLRPVAIHSRRTVSSTLTWLTLLVLLSWLTSGQAAVRFDVFVGYDSIVPEANWFPVVCEVHNDGPPFVGVVEISPGQFGQNQSRLMAVELPTGTTKRFVIPAFSANRHTYAWNARLLDEKRKVRAETQGRQVRKQNLWQIPLVGAVTRTAGGIPLLPEVKSKQAELQPGVARLQPAIFPDNPIALEGLSAIYLNSEKALDLKEGQVSALLAWLHAGGHLIVGVEQILHITGNEWLQNLLPCDLNTSTMVQDHRDLQTWLNGSERIDEGPSAATTANQPSPPSTTNRLDRRTRRPIQVITPSPPSSTNPYANLKEDSQFEEAGMQVAIGPVRNGRLVIGSEPVPLVIAGRKGRGQITVLTFSPEMEPFLSWKNRAHFWAKLVDVPAELLTSDQYNRYGGYSLDGVFGAMIDSKQVRKLPVGWLLLLLLGYLAVIGPLDQYWLKKINKQMLTWLTFPAYVALFSILIYVIGYKLRAGESEWNELHVVDVMPLGEKADLRGRTFASIYSPVNAKYQLASEQPYATLRGEFLGNYGGGQDSSRATIAQQANSFTAEIAVPVWMSQLFVSDWWRQDMTPLQVSVNSLGNRWQVRVQNRSDSKLTNVKLVMAGLVWSLGDLRNNETKDFQISRSEGTPLKSFVQNYGSRFEAAIQQRQRAFGTGISGDIQDIPQSCMAASFASELGGEQNNNRSFITPRGFDLSPMVDRGDAVLLAWGPDYSPVKPIHRFTPRRSHRDTLLRLVVPMQN